MWARNGRRQPSAGLEQGKRFRAEPERLDSAESLGDRTDHQIVKCECRRARASRADPPGDENVRVKESARLKYGRIRVFKLVDRELKTTLSLRDLASNDRHVPIHDQVGRLVIGISRGSEADVRKARARDELGQSPRVEEASLGVPHGKCILESP